MKLPYYMKPTKKRNWRNHQKALRLIHHFSSRDYLLSNGRLLSDLVIQSEAEHWRSIIDEHITRENK